MGETKPLVTAFKLDIREKREKKIKEEIERRMKEFKF